MVLLRIIDLFRRIFFWLSLHCIVFLLLEKINNELIRIFQRIYKVSCIGDLSTEKCKYHIYQHEKMDNNSDGYETVVSTR